MSLRQAGVSLIDCDHRTPPAAESGYPYVAIPQLKDGRLDLQGVRKISRDDYLEWTKKLKPQANDVIVVRRCNSGESALVPSGLECAIGQNLVVLRADGTTVEPSYLRWLVRGPEWWNEVRKFINVGAVFDSLKCRDIPNFEVLVPPKEVQVAIAETLGAIDDQIATLRETNTTLEAIAQAIFKSWFIDFDPVKAKSEGRIPDGIDEATAALFPGSFEESALGAIPKGWSTSALDRVANYLNGLALQKFPPTGSDDLPVIKIAQLRKGDSVGADLAASTIKPEYIVQDGDVLFSWSGSLEVELWCGGRGALNQHLFKVTSTAFPKWFYFLWTRHHLAHFRQVAASKATTMGHIQRAHLSDATVMVPDAEVLDAANQVLGPIIEMIIANSLEAKTLAELRDTLLPRLISGKLKLPELQEVAEAL